MDWDFDLFDTEVTHARTQGFCKIVCGSVCYNMDKSHVRILKIHVIFRIRVDPNLTGSNPSYPKSFTNVIKTKF